MFKGIVEIKKIRNRNKETGYSVLEVKIIDAQGSEILTKEPIVVGRFVSVFEGDEFAIDGQWIEHRTYGYQIEAISYEKQLPQSLKGIERFICMHVEGVGKKTAAKIVDVFKEETLKIIENQPDALASIEGITKKKAMHISESIFRHKKFEPVSMFVLNAGGSYELALWIYETYGDSSIRVIRENPYVLMDYDKEGFKLAEKFALKLQVDPYHESRFKFGIYTYLVKAAETRGDLYVRESEIYKTLNSYLASSSIFDPLMDMDLYRKRISDAMIGLIAEKSIVVCEILNDDAEDRAVYLGKYYTIEKNIVKTMKRIIIDENKKMYVPKQVIEEWIPSYEEKTNQKLADMQKEAINMALTSGASILTGGPGTGKTATINAIIKCALELNPAAEIVLLAPTGKASRRMTELTGLPASTIHSKIGLKMNAPTAYVNELYCDFVIVDEFSMADAYVCSKLLEAIQDGTCVLFVGDVDQLPSVGPGLILRDFIESGVIPTTRLVEIFRQAQNSQILLNAVRAIKGKDTNDIEDPIHWDHSKGDFFFIEENVPHNVVGRVLQSYLKMVKQYKHSVSEVQVLTPIHKGVLGTWNLNKQLQELLNPPSSNKAEISINETTIIREGDKIIHLKNNDELGVMNGETGIVYLIYEDADRGISVDVEYDNEKMVTYNYVYFEEIDLAYAMSVHKSQGSEYPVVIGIFHDILGIAPNRNSTYTFWTRAKRRLINIGTIDAMNSSIKRVMQVQRNSQIKEYLREAFSDTVAINS
ncbi:ATP-dependent RecD-like DNA helicase [Lysinibacillus sp. UGB7]|uniref:SF1B family DNA helicase RecD2 n=1 Tax=Lysinibacillus sp. UGB7 TaxID=3411039 RepID=UPI003B7941DD